MYKLGGASIFLMILNIFVLNFQATSAFDGTHVSKWEEPNGGKGITSWREGICCFLFLLNTTISIVFNLFLIHYLVNFFP